MIRTFLILLLSVSEVYSQTWEQTIDFPSAERDDGVAFTIGNFVYCGSGVIPGWQSSGDFYKFDLTYQLWTPITSLPSGNERQYACAFVHDSKGYVFGGYNGTFINTLLEYDPINNQWTELPALPSLGRGGSSCFVVEDTAYIIGGRTSSTAIAEVWAYSIHEQTWEQKNDLPFGERWKGSGISHQNNGYFGFGRKDDDQLYSDFYRYDAVNDDWIALENLPSDERCYAQFTVFEDKIVTLFGLGDNNTYLNDVWSYDEGANSWTALTTFPNEAIKGGVAFANQHSIYYSTGITAENERQKATWKLTMNDLSLDNNSNNTLAIFPNPASDFLTIPASKRVIIFDVQGNTIFESENLNLVDISPLSNGVYFIQCDENFPIKFIVHH